MRLQLLLVCPECGQTLTREEMAYGHDCEVSPEEDRGTEEEGRQKNL
jgi:hypothetical protein